MAAMLTAQTPPPTGAVEGVVVNSVTGAPVRKALVTLRQVDQYAGEQVRSDSAGRFHLQVPAGSYVAWAEAQGYAQEAPDYTRTAPRARTVTVNAGGAVKELLLRIPPAAVLSGRVLDEDGRPVSGATVQLLRYHYTAGGADMESPYSATADDRGEYRIAAITPGRYYLSANRYVAPPQAAGRVHSTVVERGYGFTFHPGVERAADAAPIDLPPGAESTQDLRLQRVRLFHIRGVVAGPLGPDAWVLADTCAGSVFPRHSVRIRQGGLFDFWGMTPGLYCLSVCSQSAQGLSYASRQVTLTDRDVQDVELTLEPGATLRGSATGEGVTQDTLARIVVRLEPEAGGQTKFGEPDARGAFTIAGLAPAAYRISVARMPGGVYVKTIRQGSADLTAVARLDLRGGAAPLELVFASGAGDVTGTASGAGAGLESLAITLAPTGPLAGRSDLTVTVDAEDPAGGFRILGIAPGAYRVFAWEMADTTLAESQEFRALLESRASPVEIRPGETAVVNPTLISADEVAEARKRLR
jgi:hypothetical protein